MNDNEIVKALEHCKSGVCVGCHYQPVHPSLCKSKMEGDVLDFINRQKAEIERLTNMVNRLKKYDEERDIRLHTRLTENARAEAIKDFAQKVDDMLWQIKVESLHRGEKNTYCETAHLRLQKLKEEMVGELQ